MRYHFYLWRKSWHFTCMQIIKIFWLILPECSFFWFQCLLNPFSLISPDVCHNVEFSECQGLYRYTTLPSLNQTELAPRFQAFFGDVLSSNCSLKALQFFCASMFTICDPKNGSVVSPCRQLCEGEDALCYTCSGWLNLWQYCLIRPFLIWSVKKK